MYINTGNKRDIEESLCMVLNINREKLYELIKNAITYFKRIIRYLF